VGGGQALDETKVQEVVTVALKYIQSGGTRLENGLQARTGPALQVPCRPDLTPETIKAINELVVQAAVDLRRVRCARQRRPGAPGGIGG